MMVIEKNITYYLGKIITYTLLCALLVITIVPFYIMIITSLKSDGALTSLSQLLPWIGKFNKTLFKNYLDVWVSGPFDTYFFNTIIVTIVVVIGNIILDTLVAYALSRKKFYGKKIVFLLILGRMMIPIQVLIIPIFVLVKKLAIYDTLLAIMLPNIIQGFGIFLIKQYFDGIPKSLDEAAMIDGATDFQILRFVLFPLAKPAVAVLIINTALSTWNAFLLPLILTQSVDNRVLGLGLALYKSQYSVDYVHSMAASTIAVIPILILFLFFQKYIISGLTRGAVK